MLNIDEKYQAVRERFRKALEKDHIQFDEQVLESMIKSRGILSQDNPNDIPAGLNLGGYSMLRLAESVLFFHHMKLRNNTHFRINSLNTDFHNMRVTAHLSLNDLHLLGSYERALTDPRDPSRLFYTPSYGQVEILLKNVKYSLEGRLKLLEDSPFIVLAISDLNFDDSLMIYQNNATHTAKPIALLKENLEEFIDRLKSDLDEWLKDYLNEQLIFFTRVGAVVEPELREYHNTRNAELNKQVENTIQFLKGKLQELSAAAVKLPNFSIYSSNGVELDLSNGVLRGLDSMYRRSIATGGVEGNIRKVDAVVSFSNLKVEYKYVAYLPTGMPPLNGLLALSADELTAVMSASMLSNPESVDLSFDFIHQLQPESLTVEGPANRMIANFKHLLEYHVVSIMSNALNYNIRSLNSLVKCKPSFYSHVEPEEMRHQGNIMNLMGIIKSVPGDRNDKI